MISFLRGNIVDIKLDYLIIDVAGVGYQVSVGRPQDFSFGEALIYTYFQVKEDGFYLYGFKTIQEQDLFIKLINVNGIGPKTASGILGATTVNALISAIELGNLSFLKKLPAIGPKAASQIILDLKGKLVRDEEETTKVKNSEAYADVYDALHQFGFKSAEIDAAINKISDIATKNTSSIIKECLVLLRK